MTADDLSAILSGIRELVSKRDEALAWVARASADDGELDAAAGAFEVLQDKLAARAPRLVAAIDAVLKLADGWERNATELDKVDAKPPGALFLSGRSNAYQGNAASVREAITRELSGTRQTQPGEDGES